MDERIKLDPAARAELQHAIDWYAAEDLAIAAEFVDEIVRSLERIAESPRRWPVWRHGARRFLVRRFPYRIVYRETNEEIVVYAISHTSRNPDHWVDRSGF